MNAALLQFILAAMLILLFLTAYLSVRTLLGTMTARRRRIRLSGIRSMVKFGHPPLWLLRACAVRTGRTEVWAEWRQLLISAGIRLEPLWYICIKRLLLALLWGTAFLAWKYRLPLQSYSPMQPWLIALAAGGAGAALAAGDRYALNSLKKYRTNRIVEEIFTVSRQLLYFSGSRLHLHGKLARCLPYTKLIRQEWHLLLNDWYQDPEGAIRTFRTRLGTEEAHGFAETLQSLRLYDGEAYYALLRQRVQDYKEKLELLRDSRKESASYALFVLAGIPIMYTFQIFIHPWVQEGKRLFDSLG